VLAFAGSTRNIRSKVEIKEPILQELPSNPSSNNHIPHKETVIQFPNDQPVMGQLAEEHFFPSDKNTRLRILLKAILLDYS
jgi:hypothetical protein